MDTRGGYNGSSFFGSKEELEAGEDLLVYDEFYGYFNVDGWILDDGGYYDPCIDRKGGLKTGIAFALFGASLLLICVVRGYEAWRQRKGEVAAEACALHMGRHSQPPVTSPFAARPIDTRSVHTRP